MCHTVTAILCRVATGFRVELSVSVDSRWLSSTWGSDKATRWPFCYCTFCTLKNSFSLRSTCLFRPSKKEEKKKSPQCDCPPSYLLLPATRLPHMALRLKPRCASDVQLAVLCDETLDSISSLSEVCVQSFHSTSERLLPSVRNTALALITSRDQDHSVVSGWNWQAGFSSTLRQWARWEVLPAKDFARQQLWRWAAFSNAWKKKVGPLSLATNKEARIFHVVRGWREAGFRSGPVFWRTFTETVFSLSFAKLMINNKIRFFIYLFINFFEKNVLAILPSSVRETPRSPLLFSPSVLVSVYSEEMPPPYLKDTSAPRSATCALEMRLN